MNQQTSIVIEQECDGFSIVLGEQGKRFRFDQEDDVEGLVNVFKKLGFNDVSYEVVC